MKELTTVDARDQLDSVCDLALSGEIVRLRNRAGALVELMPVTLARAEQVECSPAAEDDSEWAAFENRCARASD